MIEIRHAFVLSLLAGVLVMTGCDEIATGEKVQSLAVSENEDAGYGPILVTLTPDMAPVALNFRAEHGGDPAEIGKWNSYRAVLSKDGREIATGQFNLNHTGTPDSPDGSPYLLTNTLTAYPVEAGEYEIHITPTRPVEVKLIAPRIEVRRNVRNVPLPR